MQEKNLLTIILDIVLSLWGVKSQSMSNKNEAISTKKESNPEPINWADQNVKISKYFTVKEAIWLPSWNRLANEEELSEEIKENLTKLFAKMDLVREYFGKPIRVHVTLRPTKYNAEIKGAPNSSHIKGLACDFDVIGVDCDAARDQIVKDGKLEEWDMYMEENLGGNWIHLNLFDGIARNRYFKP
jgi:zinc D-Ala-D-Ala carboxypeptidase